MFQGISHLTLDSKSRFAVPSRYREILQREHNGKLVLTIDPRSACLLLYPEQGWAEIAQKLIQLPSFERDAREIQRHLLAYATECELDSSGRILVPEPHRQWASITRDLALLGQVNKFEVWDKAAWEMRSMAFRQQASEGAPGGSPVSDALRQISL